jgi:CRISPR/Cas system-associated protein Cas5 (RAMP superfamily)
MKTRQKDSIVIENLRITQIYLSGAEKIKSSNTRKLRRLRVNGIRNLFHEHHTYDNMVNKKKKAFEFVYDLIHITLLAWCNVPLPTDLAAVCVRLFLTLPANPRH